ncbi:hypothetical protein THAOC_28584 [Thalassiosira oceanica]|uniref:Uncharacterized protein n=1 Tax=Thalassiosira oceanica TaxID=159749 RepID=K0RIW8_THAOC|nr:hypothetical protein THAOC_28584 [Thalassiosira oceanica]|eukprot:EJK52179.1 hypothetical protein THAOC_28584 [Thalassiosira oceanica]
MEVNLLDSYSDVDEPLPIPPQQQATTTRGSPPAPAGACIAERKRQTGQHQPSPLVIKLEMTSPEVTDQTVSDILASKNVGLEYRQYRVLPDKPTDDSQPLSATIFLLPSSTQAFLPLFTKLITTGQPTQAPSWFKSPAIASQPSLFKPTPTAHYNTARITTVAMILPLPLAPMPMPSIFMTTHCSPPQPSKPQMPVPIAHPDVRRTTPSNSISTIAKTSKPSHLTNYAPMASTVAATHAHSSATTQQPVYTAAQQQILSLIELYNIPARNAQMKRYIQAHQSASLPDLMLEMARICGQSGEDPGPASP